jgi:hypothetical protein
MEFDRPIPRDKYLGERLRYSRKEAAYSHIRCLDSGEWIDLSELGAVVDHSGLMPHPAIDQPQ